MVSEDRVSVQEQLCRPSGTQKCYSLMVLPGNELPSYYLGVPPGHQN
jgi:hypothetical protein